MVKKLLSLALLISSFSCVTCPPCPPVDTVIMIRPGPLTRPVPVVIKKGHFDDKTNWAPLDEWEHEQTEKDKRGV